MATRDTWGGSWGTSWATSWTVQVVTQIGGGGGGPLDMGEESPPLKRIIDVVEPADRFKEQRERQGRVREQLRVALEGPQAVEVRALVEPEPVDAVEPLHERVDLEALTPAIVKRVEEYYRRAASEEERAKVARLARELEEDDEDVMWLL